MRPRPAVYASAYKMGGFDTGEVMAKAQDGVQEPAMAENQVLSNHNSLSAVSSRSDTDSSHLRRWLPRLLSCVRTFCCLE